MTEPNQKPGESERDREYRLLSLVTKKLTDAKAVTANIVCCRW